MHVTETSAVAMALAVAVGCRPAPRDGPADAGAAPATSDASMRGIAASDAAAADAGRAPGGRRLSDESTLAIAATRTFVATGSIKDPDAPQLEAAMHAAYIRMRAEEDEGLLGPITFDGGDADLLVVAGDAPRPGAVLFLHGWGGRFALPCWQLARATHMTTACPDAGVNGDWWTPESERVVRRAVDALHAAGHRQIVLVGLSNGAAGAMRLPAKMAGVFEGLVVVSGANPSVAPAGIPTFVVHGRQDGMANAEGARAYARRAGARLLMLESGHFAMLLEADRFERAVGEFVAGIARDGG